VGHTNWVRDVVYSPQGNQLASCGYDNAIRLWDVEAQESRLSLIGHSGKVIFVAYSRQGEMLASGSWDRTVRIWDVATGQCRAVMQNFRGKIYGVSWSTVPGGNFLATNGGDRSVLKWEVTNEDDSCHVRLVWGAVDDTLNVTGTSVQGVRGLSSLNKQLLEQRGAVGEPEHLLRETSQKLITMTSVTSTLKQSSVGTTADPSSLPDVPVEQIEQEQAIEHPQHP
jgi:WD40 repeat protein